MRIFKRKEDKPEKARQEKTTLPYDIMSFQGTVLPQGVLAPQSKPEPVTMKPKIEEAETKPKTEEVPLRPAGTLPAETLPPKQGTTESFRFSDDFELGEPTRISIWGARREKKPFTPYKPIKDKKLTILLIENTMQVANQKGSLEKIARGLVTKDLVYLIHYGKVVHKSGVLNAEAVANMELMSRDDIGEEACLYDALLELKSLVDQEYLKVEERETEKIKISSIEIIGIGTCKDKGSKLSKNFGIDCFNEILKKSQIMTKYFCLTEESFIDAAEVGFRSIGAISRTY